MQLTRQRRAQLKPSTEDRGRQRIPIPEGDNDRRLCVAEQSALCLTYVRPIRSGDSVIRIHRRQLQLPCAVMFGSKVSCLFAQPDNAGLN
jgi:hypothetical protein